MYYHCTLHRIWNYYLPEVLPGGWTEVKHDHLLRLLIGVDVVSRVGVGGFKGAVDLPILGADNIDVGGVRLVPALENFKHVEV